ncbi:TPA: AbgT family transporter [Clostridioides difficile]|nr:AbgT family transporter [Clostridioides difficile]HBF8778979.1 AbgT family transporter [Clostridioides difficile]HBI8315956.1 AbgT family transporter [Clostridioides difficile]
MQSALKEDKKKSGGGFLGWIERVGNKMPHPLALFTYITLIVVALSAIASFLGFSAISPSTGKLIEVMNLISAKGLILFMQEFVKNFQNFPVLGVVLVMAVATGVCEKTGFFSTAIKMSLSKVKGNAVVFIIAFIGVFANQAGDAAFVLVPTLAGAIFCGFASVGGGFATAVIPGGWDVTLTPITVSAAQTIQPAFDMTLLASYYALFVSAFIVATVSTIVTVKFIEPKLGKYTGKPEGMDDNQGFEVTKEQAKAAKLAGFTVLAYVALLVALCIPANSFLRSPEGSLIFGAPLMSCLQFFIVILFFLPGIVYGMKVGKIKTVKDLNDILCQSMATMAPFIVLAIVIGQFLTLFSVSNLAQVLAIKGGALLNSLPLPPQVIILLFLVLVAFINIFVISGSTKWMIFGPVFVPMLMQLNIHPAFTQFVYRLGDSVTNHLSPLNAFFIILLATVQKYDKNAGMGTIFSAMIPYTIGYFVVLAVLVVVWMTIGIPVGIGGQVWL